MTQCLKGIFSGEALFLVVFAYVVFYSCENENCISTSSNDLLISIQKADTSKEGKVTFESLDTGFYKVTALGTDSVFYDSTFSGSSFSLPLNPNEGQTSFVFEMLDSVVTETVVITADSSVDVTTYYRSGKSHILNVSYEKRQRIISEDCGVEIQYRNVVVDSISFPSYQLVEDQLSIFNDSNIEIYF